VQKAPASKAQRVLFFFPFPSLGGSGGVQRVLSALLEHLDRQRFDLHLVLLRAITGPGDGIPPGVTVHNLDYSRVRYSLVGLIRLVRRLQPDAVFSNIGQMNVGLLLCRPFLPGKTRIFIGESTSVSAYLKEAKRHPRLWSAISRMLYKRADKFICLSDAMKKEMAEDFGLPEEKLVRIYNPLNLDLVHSSAALGRNPFVGAGPHLVAAQRFFREKGVDLLLDSMPAVLASFPQARLTLLGDGPLEEELKQQARALGIVDSVHFAGFESNPWRYFRHAHAVILPSRVDGLPYVALEALALGAPLVATDCPGAIREVTSAGEGVILVPPEDPRALASGIISALSRHGQPPSAPVDLGKFDLQQVVQEYSKLFDPTLA
jgi:glycosyltransferase involved in cell wall biosynthesis